jgi:hypothetical protein
VVFTAKSGEGVAVVVYLKVDAAATPAVTAVGTALNNKFFSVECNGTRPAFSRTQRNLDSINKQNGCL